MPTRGRGFDTIDPRRFLNDGCVIDVLGDWGFTKCSVSGIFTENTRRPVAAVLCLYLNNMIFFNGDFLNYAP